VIIGLLEELLKYHKDTQMRSSSRIREEQLESSGIEGTNKLEDSIITKNPLIVSGKIPIIRDTVLLERTNITNNKPPKSRDPIRKLFNFERTADIEPHGTNINLDDKSISEWTKDFIGMKGEFRITNDFFTDG